MGTNRKLKYKHRYFYDIIYNITLNNILIFIINFERSISIVVQENESTVLILGLTKTSK